MAVFALHDHMNITAQPTSILMVNLEFWLTSSMSLWINGWHFLFIQSTAPKHWS